MNQHIYKQAALPALTQSLLINQIYQETLVSMHLYTQIVIIKLFTLALILIFPSSLLPSSLHGIIKRLIQKIFKGLFDSVNWEKLFDQKGINAHIVALNETILNIFHNYVPQKYIAVDDKDPVWMNKTTKSKINLFH